MEVALEVVGWFATPVVERVMKAVFVSLKNELELWTSMKEKLEKLQVILSKIQAVVDFASSQTEISNQHLIKWLQQLRDTIDEADDVFDDFEYINVSSTINSIKEGFDKFGIPTLRDNLGKLEKVVNEFDKISAGVGNLLYLLKNTKKEQQLELYKSRETGPLPKNYIIGRGNDKEYVMQWLMSDQPSNEEDQTAFYKNISLLSIVGHGGMGKTTLLQHVYQDVKITKKFHHKMWVCVSTNFDVKNVIADMLEDLTKERPRLESLGALQLSLKSAVNSDSKKFLIVLDDIWEEENEEQNKIKWENVLAPLVSGCLGGSKILITTRMESVASMMAKVIGKNNSKTLKVKGLEEKDCLQLLNAHAFAGVENPDDHKKLKFIAGNMVKKLSGSPLAAKIMGGLLNSSLDERHWDKVLNNDIGNIMPILRLSYTFLPKHLQSCFAFCGIFPQDHKFDKDDLVRMWIALGIIQSPNNRAETMEDIGGRYFDALVKKSFFDKFGNDYKMHDLLHELAQSISKHECLRVQHNQRLFSKTPETIRHLFLETSSQEELKKIEKYKNLRSLFLTYHEGDEIAKIFEATRSIRLLCICAPNLNKISVAIKSLRRLRYLKVDFTNIASQFPTSLCNLYHLQFIIWQDNYTYSDRFPVSKDMNNLSNLRYLKFPYSWFTSIPEIGKLTSLQELGQFKVQNESGYRIGELEQMNNLQKLGINSLENVKDAQEACNAKLHDKSNLTDLSLKWSSSSNLIDLDVENVLNKLQPPSCLQKLKIDKYIGSSSAIWMNKADLISNLVIIKLTNCSNWQTLPPFGQLRFLESLYLYNMPKVKQFDDKFYENDVLCVFPSLKELYIQNLKELKDWFGAASDHGMFPCLTKLDLLNCPELLELPYLPHELKTLKIRDSRWNTLNGRNSSKLEELSVSACPNITNIYLARFPVVKLLEIRDCPNLKSHGGQEVETTENCQLILTSLVINDPSILLMEPLRSITSLQELYIKNNDELVSFPIEVDRWFLKVSSSLRELNFIELKSLQYLPSYLEILSSLETLLVSHVPQLVSLPNLPPSLADLSIIKVSRLQDLPDLPSSLKSLEIIKCDTDFMNRYDKGSDSHKIPRLHKPPIFVYRNLFDDILDKDDEELAEGNDET